MRRGTRVTGCPQFFEIAERQRMTLEGRIEMILNDLDGRLRRRLAALDHDDLGGPRYAAQQ